MLKKTVLVSFWLGLFCLSSNHVFAQGIDIEAQTCYHILHGTGIQEILDVQNQADTLYFTGYWTGESTIGNSKIEDVISTTADDKDAFIFQYQNETYTSVAATTENEETGLFVEADEWGNVYWGMEFWFETTVNAIDFSTTNSSKAFLIHKLNEEGALWWSIQLEGQPILQFKDMKLDANHHLWVLLEMEDELFLPDTSFALDANQPRMALLEFDATGSFQQAIFPEVDEYIRPEALAIHDNVLYIVGDYEGNLSIADGMSISTATTKPNGFIMAYATDGTPQWLNRVSGALSKTVKAIAIQENTLVIGGDFAGIIQLDDETLTSVGTADDIFIAKMDTNGAFQSAVKYGDLSFNKIHSLATSADAIYFQTIYTDTLSLQADFKIADKFPALEDQQQAIVQLDNALSLQGTMSSNIEAESNTSYVYPVLMSASDDSILLAYNFYNTIQRDNMNIGTAASYNAIVMQLPEQAPFYTDIFPVVSNQEKQFYPNPSSDNLYFYKNEKAIHIYNQQGQHCLSAYDTQQVDIQSLAKGIYFLEIGTKPSRALFIKR